MSVAVLIVAAGRGSRAGDGLPKQYRTLGGKPVLTRTLEAFLAHSDVKHTTVVIHPDDRDLYDSCVDALTLGPVRPRSPDGGEAGHRSGP
jgi:2-C-methyl-D-erythritol 4-phosphate cytidylyltransferase/2-C-methyl-D-erythritol 2,4-cyclodiphosphate synthase